MNIWRSKHGKGKEKKSMSQPICWWPISVFCKNRSVQFSKPEHPVFTVIRWLIFLNGVQFYTFHKLYHASMFFRLCTCFLDNLVEFHSRNKEVLQTIIMWTQTRDLKPPNWSPHRDDQNKYMEHMIWCSDEEVIIFWKFSRLQNRRFQFGKSEGPVFMAQTWFWVEILTVFDNDSLIHVKGYVQPPIYM
jgi:hypothetical protein